MKIFTRRKLIFRRIAASASVALSSGLLLLLLQAGLFINAQTSDNPAKIPDIIVGQRAESSSQSGLETLQIFNVAISVSNIDESVEWYQEKLGFQLQSRRKVSTGIEIALIEKNGFFIDLIHIADSENIEGSPKEPPEHLKVQGLRNLVFWVDDLKAADAQLKSQGVQLIWESRYIPEVGTSITNFRDNSGNLIAIWERK